MKILIVDDHKITYLGLEKIIKHYYPKTAIYYATSTTEAIQKLKRYAFDLVISDLDLSNNHKNSGFELVKKLRSNKDINTKAIAYTTYNEYRIMKYALRCGFNSFVDKATPEAELKTIIEGVMKTNLNDVYTSNTMTRIQEEGKRIRNDIFRNSTRGISSLGNRELELLDNYAHITDLQKIADIMHVSIKTIETHLNNIKSKLNLKTRCEVQLFAKEYHDDIKKQINIRKMINSK